MRKLSAAAACRLILFTCLSIQAPPIRAQQTPPDRPDPQQGPAASPPAQAGSYPPFYDYPYGSETRTRRSLTVDEAVTLALANASAYQQALLEERGAREDVRQARTAFLPQLSAPFSYIGTTPSQVRAPGEPLTFSFAGASAINETTALLSATGPIDLSGRLRASLRRSRALLGAARAGTQVARRELVIATVDAYYGLVLARQKRRLADETLALAEAFASLAERLRLRGAGEEADVFRARAAAATRRDELEQARFAESAAESLLRVYTGVDFGTHIGVARLINSVPAAADFMGYTEELIKARPELAQLDAQRQAALEDERVARSELLPELTYGLSGGFDAADVRRLRPYSGGQAVISLNIPIFNFGASKSRATQARLRARALEVQREQMQRQLRQEFYTQRAAALSALARTKAAEAGANAAQQNLNLIFVRYRQNQASITDVIDAQSSYADTRFAYYQSIADYHTARVRLEVDPARKATPAQPVPPVPAAETGAHACALTTAQAPALAGLRLGMTAEQIMAIHRLTVPPADEFGVAQAVLHRADLGGGSTVLPFLSELDTVNLEFTDGRLSLVRLNYQPTDKWESGDQFVSVMAARLNAPGPWQAFYDRREKNVADTQQLRDLALECVGFRLSMGIGLEGIGADQTPHVVLEDLAAAQRVREREDAKMRREAEKKEQPNP